MWRNSLIFFCLGLAFNSVAQLGNEWIDFTQSYYKIKISKDGFYRITASELSTAGFPLSTVPASRIQLFRRGEEVALNVNANGDGTVNYLEFYGERNDGRSDATLYEAGDQPHSFYSLFTDTASYFLTYKLGSENGKRMAFSSDQNATGLTPEPYHIEDSIQLFTTNYATGIKFGSGAALNLSKYDDGEGWTGRFFSKNAVRDFSFQLESYVSSGIDPVIETVIVGGNSLNHNVELAIGPSSSTLTTLDNIEFTGWGKTFYERSFASSNIGAGGALTLRATAVGFEGASERVSVAYVRLKYPQAIQMEASENKLFTLSNPAGSRAWLQIATTNATGTRIFEVSDPLNAVRIATTNFSARVEAIIPNASDGQQVIAVTTPSTVESIEPITFPNYNLSSTNYLIVTHPALRQSGDPVRDYENYRESAQGGSHVVQIGDINELYNLYSYGDPSPLAIRHFIMDANNQNPIKGVFLIGKGLTPNFNYYRRDQTQVHVPTYGLPGSDLMYTLGIGSDPNIPGIAIGRLNAFTPDDVSAYLNKVKEMEALPYDDLFRKDFLQLSGGISQAEIASFVDIVDGFTDVLKEDFIGGRAFNTGKETSDAVEFVDVTDRVNQGVGYVTFFGHSSGTVTDIEIGRVGDPSFGFSNKAKYPIFLVNGCKAGEIYGTNFTFGEDWMIEPELGAVGFIAHSDVAASSTLRRWSNLFYQLGFGDDTFIGKTIGEVMLEVNRQYLNQTSTSNLNLTQIQQMTLQGDPVYRIFGADFPDYAIDESALSASAIGAEEILATQDSFKIDIVVKNYGRTVADSLVVQVNRTFANGSQAVYVKEFLRPLRQDTLTFFIPNDPDQQNDGLNVFTVSLDPTSKTTELNEANNVATLEVSIFSGNTVNLYPIDNGTLSNPNVDFQWQSSNLLENERAFDLELDTDPDFNSPANRKFVVSGEVLVSQTFDFGSLSLPDSSTIYWRTRYANPEPDETNEWVESSFTIVNNITDGWGQYDAEQVEKNINTGINYNQLTNRWEFDENITPIDIFTFGVDNTSFTFEDMKAIIGGLDFFVTSNTIDPLCEQSTFNAIVFDRESGDPYRPIITNRIDVFNREVCGRLPQRIYQFREQDMNDPDSRFQVLVDNMRDGDVIVLFNIGNVDYSNWDAGVISTLNSLGVSSATLSGLADGQPVIFFGRKGDAPGTASILVNDGSTEPPREQSLRLQDQVSGRFVSGQHKSKRIGPARNWASFSYNIQEETNDNVTVDVFGVQADGSVSGLVSRARAETIDVSTIDARQYPQLELVLDFEDEMDQTPPQLRFWEVNYSLPPEGIILLEDKQLQSYQEGEEISRIFSFYNLSGEDFTDSLRVMATLVNQNSGDIAESSFNIGPPLSGDSTGFEVAFSSFNKAGNNSLVVEIQADENEVYDLNNRVTLTNLIEVLADETNPILDVTFDGYHILDGDIVSPNPTISIRLRDDNAFVSKSDTTGINLSLRLPGDDAQFQRINFSDPRLTFTPASEGEDFQMEYQPGLLSDGVHALRVQAADAAGNETGEEPFEINFEVVTESAITHFYPYPNPFSTSCRFVFTLTGTEIPDQIKIQIMTVSGRVVREITQDEIGPIRVGNNITQYAWDGRDEFGDQLANGVYFYKVFLNANGNAIERRSTSADRAFKNGFGKLYILR